MHLFSVLFTAQTVDKDFRTEEGIRKALDWAKASGLHKVYIESYRDSVFVDQEQLERVRDIFENEGYIVHGCVTPTEFPGRSNHWEIIMCFGEPETRKFMETIFRRTAAVFDTIMIDDFLFSDCTCEKCDAARGGRSFGDYHSDIIHEVSVENILKPAREVNPNCKVIIKYPLWYEGFHDRGYDTVRQTEDYDLIWIGTETRDPSAKEWGGEPQTQGTYIMAWGNKLGNGKCMGGWYDSIACSPETYLEQARQTILGQARESMLFCYEGLTRQQGKKGEPDYGPGIEDTEALRRERAGLDKLAYLVETKKIVGVSVPKKPHYDAVKEPYLSSYYAMLGIPVDPAVELEEDAKAVLLGAQAVGYHNVRDYLFRMKAKGAAVVCSAGFESLTGYKSEDGVPVVDPGENNWSLMEMPLEQLKALRDYLTTPLGLTLEAPAQVALNLYDDDLEVLQNFNDFDVEVKLDIFGRSRKARRILLVLSEDKQGDLKREGTCYTVKIPARSLVVLG